MRRTLFTSGGSDYVRVRPQSRKSYFSHFAMTGIPFLDLRQVSSWLQEGSRRFRVRDDDEWNVRSRSCNQQEMDRVSAAGSAPPFWSRPPMVSSGS